MMSDKRLQLSRKELLLKGRKYSLRDIQLEGEVYTLEQYSYIT